jgi:hypothetical protein
LNDPIEDELRNWQVVFAIAAKLDNAKCQKGKNKHFKGCSEPTSDNCYGERKPSETQKPTRPPQRFPARQLNSKVPRGRP